MTEKEPEIRHVMLDLETAATGARAMVLQVGLVAFYQHPDSVWDRLSVDIEIEAQEQLGRELDPGTMLWWLKQSAQARQIVLGSQDRMPLKDALDKIDAFINPDDRVWGNGAAFDNTILTSLYDDMDRATPWMHYNNRCYRTFKALFGGSVDPHARMGVFHNGVDDAQYQAEMLVRMAETSKIILR